MAVKIHITIIELNALHTKRQNLFQELDAVIHLLMEAKHWGLRKSRNATSLNSSFKGFIRLKVKLISVNSRRVIGRNNKKASRIGRLETKQWGMKKNKNGKSLNNKFKSLDTLKVKIISVTFRRVIRTNHKKASKIWRHENIQLGGCQSCRLFLRKIRANTISLTFFQEIVQIIANSLIKPIKIINQTKSTIINDI